MTHYVVRCRQHGTDLGQCRCPSPDKEVRLVACTPLCPSRVPFSPLPALLPSHEARMNSARQRFYLDPITGEEVVPITPAMRRLLSPTAHRMTQREIEEMPTTEFSVTFPSGPRLGSLR